MQDLEFTIQENRLYLLQTRSGKRTAKAAVKIAVDLVNEGLISEKEALRRMDPEMARFFMHPMIDPEVEKNVLALGLQGKPGCSHRENRFHLRGGTKSKRPRGSGDSGPG